MNIVYDWAIYDREIIGSSTNEIGYDAGSYQKFMKQWNLTQDSIDTEIRRGQADIQEALDQLKEIREKIQKDKRLDADGTSKNDTLEKAETRPQMKKMRKIENSLLQKMNITKKYKTFLKKQEYKSYKTKTEKMFLISTETDKYQMQNNFWLIVETLMFLLAQHRLHHL